MSRNCVYVLAALVRAIYALAPISMILPEASFAMFGRGGDGWSYEEEAAPRRRIRSRASEVFPVKSTALERKKESQKTKRLPLPPSKEQMERVIERAAIDIDTIDTITGRSMATREANAISGINIKAKKLELSNPSLAPPPQIDSKKKDVITYKDFDLSARSETSCFVWPDYYLKDSVDMFIQKYNLDECIPMLGKGEPKADIAAINLITSKISELISAGEIYPICEQLLSEDNYLALLARNCTTLPRNISTLPDLDVLYYRIIDGVQHLFLRTSSQHMKLNEDFKRGKAANNIYAHEGEVRVRAKQASIDHINMQADKVELKMSKELIDRACKLKASEIIYIEAPRQKHETLINKWVKYSKSGSNYVHAEGVQSIDECQLIAPIVVQKGNFVENVGISVEAWCFQDQGTHTVNRPAKITLYNHSHAEKHGWFSKRTSDFERWDDVLVPTRYKVNYYKSFDRPNEGGSNKHSDKKGSIKFSYTLIDAGAEIIVLKEDKQDIPVEEKHKIEIYESSSGFSIFGLGRAGTPDPIGQLRNMHSTYHSKDMIGLTTATISAVAKTIRAYEDLKGLANFKERITDISNLNLERMLKIMSRFIESPSLQFGTQSINTTVEETKTHGNFMKARNMVFHNAEKSTFCGTYEAEDSVDIKTKTFVTFALPYTITSRTSVHQSGVSVDLLSFALACVNPQIAGVTSALLGSASVSVGSQDTKSHSVCNVPTTIRAGKQLKVEAENGYLTQAQIKAAIVHAVFTNDLVLKTLYNENWTSQKGYKVSFSALSEAMKKGVGAIIKTANIGIADSGKFEKIIDDFACMVGTDKFYLKVGNILVKESAFLGHKDHDPKREHIECKKIQEHQLQNIRKTWNNSFSISVSDLIEVADEIKKLCFDNYMSHGVSPKEAEELADKRAEEETEKIAEELREINQALEEIDRETNENLENRLKHIPEGASEAEKKSIKEENEKIIEEEVKKAAQKKKNIISRQLIGILQKKHMEEKKRLSSSNKTTAVGTATSENPVVENDQPDSPSLTSSKADEDVLEDEFFPRRRYKKRKKKKPNNDIGPKIDPNTIDWNALLPNRKIRSGRIDWDKIQTIEQIDKVDFDKVELEFKIFRPGDPKEFPLPDHIINLMFKSSDYKMRNCPPTFSDGLEFTIDAMGEPVEASIEVLSGLWDYVKHVYNNPRAALHEAKKCVTYAKEYIIKCARDVREYCTREGKINIEALRNIIKHPDLLPQAFMEGIVKDPLGFSRKVLESDGMKLLSIVNPHISTATFWIETGLDFWDGKKSREKLKKAIYKLRNKATSSCVSDIIGSKFGRKRQISFDILTNFGL